MSHRWIARADWTAATSLSLPAHRGPVATEAYGLPSLTIEASTAGAWVGRRAQGAAVNCDDAHLCIHSAGTHTECAAHISDQSFTIADVAPLQLLHALLLSCAPSFAEDGTAIIQATDLDAAWQRAVAQAPSETIDAVILRTRAPDERPHHHWSGTSPPFMSLDAIERLRSFGVLHLVCDLPSLDPEADGGALAAHRRFFGIDTEESVRQKQATVTELAWIPAHLQEGPGLLRLDVIEWPSDAAPSRPIFYPLND